MNSNLPALRSGAPVKQDEVIDVPTVWVDLENNREERLPCVLLVDGSGSMQKNDAIGLLNSALRSFAKAIKQDERTAMRVQLTVIRFGGTVDKLCEWTDAENFDPPEVLAGGETPMGEAMELAMRMVQEQIDLLRSKGVARKRPWIWLLSDGQPTDPNWQNVAAASRAAQQSGKFLFYPVSIITDSADQAHSKTLKAFGHDRRVITVQGAEFDAFFEFMKNSMTTASVSKSEVEDVLPFSSVQRSM